MSQTLRKPTNLTIDRTLVEAARAEGVNISRAAEAGIAEALRNARARTWAEENREALLEYARWIEENGLPLERYRQF